MGRPRTLLPQTRDALATLGMLVAQGRRRRGWTAEQLAERAGVSAKTLRKVERGDSTVAVGTAIEAAALVGVPLFGDPDRLGEIRAREADRLAVLPERIHPTDEDVDDDF